MDQAVGVVLAGGRSRRMGGREKSFLPFLNGLLLTRTLERFAPQVKSLLLSANGDPARFAPFDLQVIPDARPDQPGPLAGIEAAMLAGFAPWVVTVAVDLPFLPPDLIERLAAAVPDPERPVVVRSLGRIHPVVGLWPRRVLPGVCSALDAGQRRLLDWLAVTAHEVVDFPELPGGVDPFFNVNDPDSLRLAEGWAVGLDAGREA